MWKTFEIKFSMLKSEQENEERKLIMDVMRARYDHETERLKDLIRQREMEKDRFRQKLEDQVLSNTKPDCRDMVDRKGDIRPNELFIHANQLNDILDSGEREIQVSVIIKYQFHCISNVIYRLYKISSFGRQVLSLC